MMNHPHRSAELLMVSELEMRVAEHVGRARAAHAGSSGYRSRFSEDGKSTTSLENHTLGVRAELAIARHLRLRWQPHVGTIEGVDVGADVEVRCRRMRDRRAPLAHDPIEAGLLTLGDRDRDKWDKAFVLVHAMRDEHPSRLYAVGWRLGADVMQAEHRRSDPDVPRGVWRLPHHKLRTIPELIRFLDFRHEQRYDDRLNAILGGTAQDGRAGSDQGRDAEQQ